jgi:hypothetical protein
MPYIKQSIRPDLLAGLRSADNAGELNFKLTAVCLDYLKHQGRAYSVMNDIVGALECAKLEFYRRAVAQYENEKIEVNGDVY